MNPHLDENELSRWLAGERSPQAERHLRVCGRCRAEAERTREIFHGLHESLREGSAQEAAAYDRFCIGLARGRAESVAVPKANLGWLKLCGATVAAAFIAVAAWLPWHSTEAPAPVKSEAGDDAALLNRIDNEVSRTVPASMEPLTKLIDWAPEEGAK